MDISRSATPHSTNEREDPRTQNEMIKTWMKWHTRTYVGCINIP